jgi:hypothetical protein
MHVPTTLRWLVSQIPESGGKGAERDVEAEETR